MKLFFLITLAICIAASAAFAPISSSPAFLTSERTNNLSPLHVFQEKERDALTRESEPEDYFQT